MAEDKKAALEEIFNSFDADNSGKIDKKELRSALKALYDHLKEKYDDAKLDTDTAGFLEAVDTSNDGKIDKSEWFKFFDQILQ